MAGQNLNPFMETGATFSPCGLYRYRLWRYWDKCRAPVICYIMLNPSTMDSDRTVERCERRARMMGYGGLEVVNIFAFRSSNPVVMEQQRDPIGPGNDATILSAANISGMVVCAWGSHGEYLNRGQKVAALLRRHGIILHCLAVTENGHPEYPLYVGCCAKPTVFTGLK